MPRAPDLFRSLSTTPPDDLAALCRKLQEEKPETARIMASALVPARLPAATMWTRPDSNGVMHDQSKYAGPPRPPLLKSVPRSDAEYVADGGVPHGYDPAPLPPEALTDPNP